MYRALKKRLLCIGKKTSHLTLSFCWVWTATGWDPLHQSWYQRKALWAICSGPRWADGEIQRTRRHTCLLQSSNWFVHRTTLTYKLISNLYSTKPQNPCMALHLNIRLLTSPALDIALQLVYWRVVGPVSKREPNGNQTASPSQVYLDSRNLTLEIRGGRSGTSGHWVPVVFGGFCFQDAFLLWGKNDYMNEFKRISKVGRTR